MGAFRLFVFLVISTWLGCSSAFAEKRVALVIGNSAYQKVAKLPNPANDAAAVAAMLKAAGFDSVESRANLSAVDLRKALRDFGSKARDADMAVVYYAGHGIELDGINYLIPWMRHWKRMPTFLTKRCRWTVCCSRWSPPGSFVWSSSMPAATIPSPGR